MSEQQSQKRGVRSDAQKTERARDGYEPIPPSNPVAGAFGDNGFRSVTKPSAVARDARSSGHHNG